jgi:hypothetical protein
MVHTCYLFAMSPRRPWACLTLLSLWSLGCQSEDPRLPKQIYDEAIKLNQQGKGLEAKVLFEQLAARFPDTDSGKQARKDVVLVESFVKRDFQERRKANHLNLKRIVDALTRYQAKRTEFPERLLDLVPEYLEQVPESPWGHPFLYRPYVTVPMVEIAGRRGAVTQKFNTKLDGYYLACLGTDMAPGGEGLAADLLVKNGEWLDMNVEKAFPPVPTPQPIR